MRKGMAWIGHKQRGILWALGILCLLPVLFFSLPALGGETPKELGNLANTQIRGAEKLMFSGKAEEARDMLLQGLATLEKLKEIAPGDSKIKGLENKARQVQKQLERKLGAPLEAVSAEAPKAPESPEKPTVAAPTAVAAPTVAPPKPSSEEPQPPKKHSYHLREKLKRAKRFEEGAKSALKWVDTYKADGESASRWLPKIEAAESELESLKKLLEECAADAAKEGAPGHPDILVLQESQEKLSLRCSELRQEQQEALAQEEGAAGEALERGQTVIAFYERLEQQHKDLLRGAPLDYSNLENPPYEEALQRLEDFRSQEVPAIQETLGILNPLYGTTPSEIEENMRRAGYSGNGAPWYSYSLLQEAPDKVEETRMATAKDLAAKVEHRMGYLSGMHDFARLDTHEVIREYARLARAFAPEDKAIEAMTQGLEERLQKDKQAWLTTIQARKWPGSLAGKDTEETAGMAFFENDPGWGNREDGNRIPRRVAIRGEWNVQAKDILGQPTMYGIPALVAVEVPAEKENHLIRVYNVTLRTAEQGGIQPEPPFVEITVGDSWYIPSEALE